VFPNIAGVLGHTTPKGRKIATDADFAEALLDEAHVALVPGAAFGMSPYLRISYATDDTSLSRAMDRIGGFVRSLS
jgi:aspartate aminotransferase